MLGFLVARQRSMDPAVARSYRVMLFALFLALAVFGLVYAATANGRLYWIRPTFQPTRPFGPYINPTNFAGVMELATPWIAGAAFVAWRSRAEREVPPLLYAAAAALCVVASLMTASRSSALLLAATLSVLVLAAVRGARRRLAVLGACGATIVALEAEL